MSIVKFLLTLFISVALFGHGFCMSRKPIYVFGHQANSLEEVIPYLEAGANALESDVQFHKNGTVKELFHGCPGDCKRSCNERADLPLYLKYLRRITDPLTHGSYYDQLIMQFFDMKLKGTNDKERAGREIAKAVIDHLWGDEKREQEIRVLFYVNDIEDYDAIRGILREFRERGQQHRLKDVGFDGGLDSNITAIGIMFKEFKIENVWLGDGTINCFSADHSDARLKQQIEERDRPGGFIKKVYDWTIDSKYKMRKSLQLGVDGFITNTPDRLIEVLHEPYYWGWWRVATPKDNPFEKHPGFNWI